MIWESGPVSFYPYLTNKVFSKEARSVYGVLMMLGCAVLMAWLGGLN